MLTVKTGTPTKTFELAKRFAGYLPLGTVLALTGDLGAGKTVFAQGIAAGLGVTAHVTSPTFTIVNEYRGRIPFYHIDAYRLEDESEIFEFGFEEYFFAPAVTLVEWPQQIEAVLPEELIRITIDSGWQDTGEYRMITMTSQGDRYTKLLEEFAQDENFSS